MLGIGIRFAVERGKPSLAGADPDQSLPVLQQCQHHIALQAVLRIVLFFVILEFAAGAEVVIPATAFRANPHRADGIMKNTFDAIAVDAALVLFIVAVMPE